MPDFFPPYTTKQKSETEKQAELETQFSKFLSTKERDEGEIDRFVKARANSLIGDLFGNVENPIATFKSFYKGKNKSWCLFAKAIAKYSKKARDKILASLNIHEDKQTVLELLQSIENDSERDVVFALLLELENFVAIQIGALLNQIPEEDLKSSPYVRHFVDMAKGMTTENTDLMTPREEPPKAGI